MSFVPVLNVQTLSFRKVPTVTVAGPPWDMPCLIWRGERRATVHQCSLAAQATQRLFLPRRDFAFAKDAMCVGVSFLGRSSFRRAWGTPLALRDIIPLKAAGAG